MPTLHFPRQFKEQLDGRLSFNASAGGLIDILRRTLSEFPASHQIFFDAAGGLAPFIHVFVDGVAVEKDAAQDTYVSEDSEIVFVNAVAGG